MLAVAGEITSLAMLEWWSSAVHWARIVLVVATALIAVLVIIYAVLATVSLIGKGPSGSAKPKEEPSGSAKSGRGKAAKKALQELAQDFAFSAERSAAI